MAVAEVGALVEMETANMVVAEVEALILMIVVTTVENVAAAAAGVTALAINMRSPMNRMLRRRLVLTQDLTLPK